MIKMKIIHSFIDFLEDVSRNDVFRTVSYLSDALNPKFVGLVRGMFLHKIQFKIKKEHRLTKRHCSIW